MSETGARRAACPPGAEGRANVPTDGTAVRVRRLPSEETSEAIWRGLKGRNLELELQQPSLELGALVEVTARDAIFWGECYRMTGVRALVHIENSLNLAGLSGERPIWE